MAKAKHTNGKGRPRVGSTAILVRLPPTHLELVDGWIGHQPIEMARPEAIRRIIAIALAPSTVFEAKKKKVKRRAA